MPTKPQAGMVCAGAVSRTTAGTHPAILAHLGPVKAASLRVASRAVNAMRAGYPVASYEELADTPIILLSAPDDEMEALIRDCARAPIPWKRKIVILADSRFDSAALGALADLGAENASFNMLPEFANRKYLLEGSRRAVLAARRFLESPECRAILLNSGTKSHYFAASRFLELALTTLLASGSTALRQAGVRSGDVQAMLEHAASQTVWTYFKAGQNALSNLDTSMYDRHLDPVCRTSPVLCEYYREILSAAGRLRPDIAVSR